MKPEDGILKVLREAFSKIEGKEKLSKLIPQVGLNMVYSRSHVDDISDVAGLSGRVIISMGAPRVCGEVIYGGSGHIGSVIVELSKLESKMRAAVVVKGRNYIARTLEEMGLRVHTLPAEATEGCPVSKYLREGGGIFDAYFHPGAFGVEPTITVVAGDPGDLVEIIEGLADHVEG